MNFTEATEIRKLTPAYTLELARLLYDTWTTLMSKIPEKLEKENYECRIEGSNISKYNSGHVKLIEQASITTKRLPADILFEEWGSSGRVRPTLGHLLFLLQECRLYGAADYVANILGKSPPERPRYGPEAKIELTPTERRQIEDSHSGIRSILEEMNYPSSNIEQTNIIQQTENNTSTQHLPQIVINYQLVSNDNNEPNVNQNDISDINRINNNICRDNSDMIQFSLNRIPDISDLLDTNSECVVTDHSNVAQPIVPNLSVLLNGSLNSVASKNFHLPNSSILNSKSFPSVKSSSSSNLPDFDAIQSHTNSSIPRTLGSPLPSLTLNTLLKHYTYAELEVATNNFNETPYIYSPLQEPNPSCGRLLGSGAFGSVHLAFGVLNRPIAVKKINLKDLNIVRADDFITKQFTTEVEILYKYKHENLLSLIGYSCDGMTYCLIYEYIPGGNLKDRLQTTSGLDWTERLDIAMGTSDAVAYLHTAYSTPLIHRDIKSANILLDARNQPKLCDFGIIRISSSTTTGTNQILGTSAYMAPEAHRGDVSVKMDTYSFGVVLLELLTGLPPIDYERNGNDIVTYVQDNLEDENDITPLLDVKAGIWRDDSINYAEKLCEIAMKCLHEKRNRPTMIVVRDNLRLLFQNRKL